MLRRALLALVALLPLTAAAQGVYPYTNRAGDGPAEAGDPPKLSERKAADAMKADAVSGRFTTPSLLDAKGRVSLTSPGTMPINPTGNSGLAPTYFGRATFDVPGIAYAPNGHLNLTGTTRGWNDGTCLLSVNANPSPSTNVLGCGQGNFWDPWYRTVYPGQDSDAVSFGINGIVPVATNAPVTAFGPATVTNFAGKPQVVGAVTLSSPLSAAQVATINAAAAPMRVQVNNGYFGYTIPAGLTQNGAPVAAASSDGTTLLVDNFTRALVSGNTASPGTPGGTAALPTLPYLAEPGNGGGAGSGVFPNQVGLTNGSPPLSSYTVTIDGNQLAEVMYVNASTGPDDILNSLRISEEALYLGKTGASTWNDLEPLSDMLNGQVFETQLHLASCNQDGNGLGTCGAYAILRGGIKRGIVLENGQVNTDEGSTEGVLDIQSTIGWKSVKSSGYVLWIDPGNTGTPLFVMDAQGNVNDAKRIFVGTGAQGVVTNPNGTVVASALVAEQGALQLNNPAAGSTATVPANTRRLWITGVPQSGSITIPFPPSPVEGQSFEVFGIGGLTETFVTQDGSAFESDASNATQSGSVAVAAHRATQWNYRAALNIWQREF